ncbi:hypothetical protein L7F22_001634 [Adiantum nelumboides]|nr:hypothetical protein [Adiantum nelumboides]
MPIIMTNLLMGLNLRESRIRLEIFLSDLGHQRWTLAKSHTPTHKKAMIVCVAVVGQQNNPLFIQSFTDGDDELKFHYIVHCSLDVIEEKVTNPKKTGTTMNETFLGLLYPTEDYKVYGYLTNTKVKFLLVTTDQDVRDVDVRNVSITLL